MAAARRQCCRRRQRMPILEALFLNPFEKFWRYGRFPWTFAAHLVLVALVTAQALLFLHRDVQHVSRTIRHFARLFVSSDGNPFGDQVSMSQPSELQGSFEHAVRNHFFINNVSIVNFQHDDDGSLHVWMSWRDGSRNKYEIETSAYVASITEGTSQTYLQQAFPCLYDLTCLPRIAAISMRHNLLEFGYPKHYLHEKPVCIYRWGLETTFDGSESGEFYGRVRCHASDCRGNVWSSHHFVHLTCGVVALISLVLLARKVLKCLWVVRRLRASSEAWSKVSRADVIALFSPWWLLTLGMHILQIAACYVCMQSSPDTAVRFRWVGFSCFLTWLNIAQYFEFFPGYYMAFHTISIGAGRVFRFLLSVVPILYAFVMLSVCLFSQSRMFDSPSAAMSSLFSLLNGDSILDLFAEVYGIGGHLGQLFLYIFLFLFTYIVLNVNITIIQEAYEMAKKHPHRESLRRLRDQIGEQLNCASDNNHCTGGHCEESVPCGMPSPEPLLASRQASFAEAIPQPKPSAAAQIGDQPKRSLSGYMSPRFFERQGSITHALIAAYPEDSYLAHLPTPPPSPPTSRPPSRPPSRHASKPPSPALGPQREPSKGSFSAAASLPPLEPAAASSAFTAGEHHRGPSATLKALPWGATAVLGSGESSWQLGEEPVRADQLGEGAEDLELVSMPTSWEWEDFDRSIKALERWGAQVSRSLPRPPCCSGQAREELTAGIQRVREAVDNLAALRLESGTPASMSGSCGIAGRSPKRGRPGGACRLPTVLSSGSAMDSAA